MRAKDALGAEGEQVAAEYLKRRGCLVLARNWRGPRGEVDIVARDGNTLVVCEVKTRSGVGYGSPFEAVTATKAARLRGLAADWLCGQDGVYGDVRVDVVGVVRGRTGALSVEHLKGVA